MATLRGDLQGSHWDMLRSILPLYQAITTVALGNGRSTLFWIHVWNDDEALADRFPALFSQSTQKEASVSQAIHFNLQNSFVTRLSTQAVLELDQVRSIIRQTALSESEEDQRQSPFSSGPGKIDTSAIYKLLNARGRASDPSSEFIWHNKAPPRVQLFM